MLFNGGEEGIDLKNNNDFTQESKQGECLNKTLTLINREYILSLTNNEQLLMCTDLNFVPITKLFLLCNFRTTDYWIIIKENDKQ